ncbi:hypothetical protein ELG78_16800 [Rhizobium leguminosarum]|uniref:hypothetical protein n=1 Tax=Rhizobium leguminosarum TaxID=384 RepID=UPI001031F81A|nr:hypothetical protein ELG78_16800 [Rhizobium leguminosarum]
MSDTDKPALTMAPKMYVHFCEDEGCEKWGGFGRSASKDEPPHWWCWEHFPHKSHEQEQALIGQRLEAIERESGAK